MKQHAFVEPDNEEKLFLVLHWWRTWQLRNWKRRDTGDGVAGDRWRIGHRTDTHCPHTVASPGRLFSSLASSLSAPSRKLLVAQRRQNLMAEALSSLTHNHIRISLCTLFYL